MLLKIPRPEAAQRLRSFFAESDYSEGSLARYVGRTSPIFLSRAEKQEAARKLQASGPTAALIRLFFLEHHLDNEQYRLTIPAAVRADIEATGLVSISTGNVSAGALIVPVGKLLIAGDRFEKLATESDIEHVLSVNPPARFLLNITVRKAVDRFLDLCTGNGIFAVAAAASAKEIVATDLNPRALEFASFNAALNAVGNIDLRAGAGFEPVQGEKFDQIVCNPPYIITPANRSMCTDNSLELDGFCRDLVNQAPAYLAEGGLLQMICEWVEIEQDNWQGRLAEWFNNSGCDAWVICSGYTAIEEYAKVRSQQSLGGSQQQDHELTYEWLKYFRDRKVLGVRSGFIQLRRRKGNNWQSFTSLGGRVTGQVGDSVASGFVLRDRYQAADDSELLALRPVPASGVALQKPANAGQQSERLINTHGLPVSFVTSSAVAAMIERMDGSRTLAKISDEIADAASVARAEARGQCCSVARELLSQGLLSVRGP